MTPNEAAAMNIGEAVRGGLRLTATEAVALVHEACVQLDAAVLTNLPVSTDELSLGANGLVVVPKPGEPQLPHMAAAGLLEQLLAGLHKAEPVPQALRSLPARLRVARADKTRTVSDLITILRWYVREDPKKVVQDLFTRVTLPSVQGETLDWNEPAEVMVTKRRPRRTGAWLAVAAALVAFFLSGYLGARYSSSARVETAPPPVASAAPPVSPAAPPDSAAAPSVSTPAPPVGTPRIVPAPKREEPRPLILPVRGGAFSPSFTAQSRTLLFHAGRNTAGHLYTATLDDRGLPANVTPLIQEAARNYHARLSPDGQWIAFDSDRDGERGVYIADTTGATISRVNGEGFGAVPSWSPDMKSLAFIRAEPGRPRVWNLWIRTLATGAMTRATQHRTGQVWGASWFPDSNSFAYSHDTELIIADRSGRQLASYASPIPGRMVRTPAVSPDGRQIVFQIFRKGVWILDVASGRMRALLDDPSAEEFAWDPSGRRIAYHSRRDGEWRIWVLTL